MTTGEFVLLALLVGPGMILYMNLWVGIWSYISGGKFWKWWEL